MDSKISVVKLEAHDTGHGGVKNECTDSAGLTNQSDVGSERCAIATSPLQKTTDFTKDEFFSRIKKEYIHEFVGESNALEEQQDSKNQSLDYEIMMKQECDKDIKQEMIYTEEDDNDNVNTVDKDSTEQYHQPSTSTAAGSVALKSNS